MNVEALNHAIRVLKKVKADKQVFNLTAWSIQFEDFGLELNRFGNRNTVSSINEVLQTSSQIDDVPECGTVRCVIGWCAQDPYFIENGLSLTSGTNNPSPMYVGSTDADPEFGWSAVAKTFDITMDEAETLFSMLRYTTREETTIDQVIDRIQTFMCSTI